MSSIASHIPAYRRNWRRLKDILATSTITIGGMGVLVAILLIFFYLVYEVVPLFKSAHIESQGSYQLTTGDSGLSFKQAKPLYLATEEQAEVGFRVDEAGQAIFFDVATGQITDLQQLTAPGEQVTALAEDTVQSRRIAIASGAGDVQIFKHDYRISYPDDKRVITPRLESLHDGEVFQLETAGAALDILALRETEAGMVIAGEYKAGELSALRYTKEEDFLTEEVVLTESPIVLPNTGKDTHALYIDPDLHWLFQLNKDGSYNIWDLETQDQQGYQDLASSGRLFEAGATLKSSALLLGGLSILAGSDQQELAQYFLVYKEGVLSLEKVRPFANKANVVAIQSEHRRKGFLTLNDQAELSIYHSTSERLMVVQKLALDPVYHTISPRADLALIEGMNGKISRWHIENEHPEISWAALWSKVWYESYPEPDYIWQSSSSSNDFEPKYSFSPLAFGTLKAAFYAMLFAAPLAICGAIYTAYFMAPAMRKKVKPLIELMEALPTVILGFLAGLWLAPFVESHLTGVFAVLMVLPVGILLFAYAWSRLPADLRNRIPDGWHAAILLPVVCLLLFGSFETSDFLELIFFGGDMRAWLTLDLGISFDQRNALVVGIAMGVAVIPTIFSIAEDAVFSVPKHLSYGSLALGATPWQTMVGVVLPTASPGIFSGLMIGMGRAVGETMIVLMATGNTPIMDANIFEGMRTLAANIAVEVPEAEVDSTHYRVLFLAAFVLFLFTFIVNTIAEVVRQRLRKQYGTL